MRCRWATGGVLAALTCAPLLPGQIPTQQKPQVQPAQPVQQDLFLSNYQQGRPHGDLWEELFSKGVSYFHGALEIHADSAVVFFDRDERSKSIEWGRSKKLPRRGTSPPATRRQLTEEVMREHLASLIRSMGQKLGPSTPESQQALRLFRSLYMEGNVVVRHGGVEVVRCKSIYLSTVDDRVVFRDVTMRLVSPDKKGSSRVVVVRGPKLVRQGKRTSGRNVSITTCEAGKPHFEVFTGQVEVIERKDDFEVRTQDNTIAFSGIRMLPLPNVSFFTSDQNQLPIQRVSLSYDETERFIAEVDLGGSMNDVGGAVHHFLTGGDPSEFRGDWHLGLGYNRTRGYPFEPGLTYQAEGLYRGSVLGYYLNDHGKNIRQIQFNLNGTPIDNEDRSMVRTENRIFLGSNTYLDLSLFDATDPAVWSEFFKREYMRDEIPETSAWLRHDEDNLLVTVEGRWNMATFSYADDRALANAFNERLPVATLDWFSQKITDLPGDGELLITTSTNVGQQRSNYDNTFAPTPNDRTFRVDQEVELSAPYYFSVFALRPYASAGFTHYDLSVAGNSRERWRFGAGAVLSTRIARTYHAKDARNRDVRIQHVMSPTIEVDHLYKVDGQPSQFFQHDNIDAADERAKIRFGLINRLLHVRQYEEDELEAAKKSKDYKGETHTDVRQVLWLDAGQNLYPISGRDNMGHHIGYLDYEMILKPIGEWIPVPNMTLYLEGEHDWIENESRTLNAALSFGKVLGIHWAVNYFKDNTTDGAIGYGAHTDLFGRWDLAGQGQYDLQQEQNLNYLFTLARRDHDWIIAAELEYDVVTKDTSFHITFEPVFGGLFKQKRSSVYGGRMLRAGSRTYY